MALHTELKIYKDAYDLLKQLVDLTKNMPRDFKQLIGGKMRDDCLELIAFVVKANISRDKREALSMLLEKQQGIEVLLRAACDMRWISQGQYAKTIFLTSGIGKQANGWRNKNSASLVS